MSPKFWKQTAGEPLICPEFFNGMLVKLDKNLTESEFVIDKPSRFIEYEPKDYPWLIYFDMGRWTQVPSKTAYVIEVDKNRKTLVMHPDTWDAIKRHTEEQKKRQREFAEILDSKYPQESK